MTPATVRVPGRPVLAIDPGPTRCAFVFLEDARLDLRGIEDTDAVVRMAREAAAEEVHVAIETIEPWAGVVGPAALDTMRVVGRLEEAAHAAPSVTLLKRSAVLKALGVTGLPKGKAQAAVRLLLLDMWGGGNPARRDHPLHGVRDDVWSALAVAVAFGMGGA